VTDGPQPLAHLASGSIPQSRERRDIEVTMQDKRSQRSITGRRRGVRSVLPPEWHQGVVGVVATARDRITVRRSCSRRPETASFAVPGAYRQVSARCAGSGGRRAPGMITRFGGHAFAAGLSLPESELAHFTVEFERVAREWLTAAQLERRIETDGDLSVDELTLDLAQDFSTNVWGQGFPRPSFDNEFKVAAQRLVGGKHLKLALTMGNKDFEGILFSRTDPY
jgi:single-stranded-DNA-specific exonuclease